MLIHGSCAAQDGHAVLILGPSGSGKSDLVLRLLERGWGLVADDQVELTEPGMAGEPPRAAPPPALAGMLEVRGLGLLCDLPHQAGLPVALALRLAPRAEVERLPCPRRETLAGAALPALTLHAFDASTPRKLTWALAVATGRARMASGAFAA